MEFLNSLLSKLGELLSTAGLRLLAAALVLLIGLKLAKFIVKLIQKGKGFSKIDAGVQTFLLSFIKIAMNVLIFLTAANVLGIPMTNFVALITSAGVAVGLAMQGSLSNLAGGIMILVFKPFRVNDFIDTAQGSGTVTEITILYTILTTPDNRRIVIPNGAISNEAITNYSYNDTRRLDLTFSVSYDSDIEKVRSILLEAAQGHALSLKDPEPFCRLSEHGDSSLDIVLRVWVKKDDYWDLHFDLKEQVTDAFAKNDIKIPFPQMDVHVDNK